MSDMTSNGRGRRCPVCERGILRPRLISEVFAYGDGEDSVVVRTWDVPIEDCDSCGESFSGPEAARIRHEAIGRAFGFLQPQEIRAIRDGLGQSAEHFAKLVGVGIERLAQWEEGALWQDRTADRLMRLLSNRPENAGYLESLIKGQTPESRKVQPQDHGSLVGGTSDHSEPQEVPVSRAATENAVGPLGAVRRIRRITPPGSKG